MSAKDPSTNKDVEAPPENVDKAAQEKVATAQVNPAMKNMFKNKPCIIFTTLCVVLVGLLAIMLGVITTSGDPEQQFLKDYFPEPLADNLAHGPSCHTSDKQVFKGTILRAHNLFRMKPSLNGSFGAEMLAMEWDNDLAEEAARWGNFLCMNDRFEIEPSIAKSRKSGKIGQNILLGFSEGHEEIYAKLAVVSWFNEIRYATPEYMFPCSNLPRINHYMQLIWARSFRVGCALTRGPVDPVGGPKCYVVCNYMPGVNCSMNAFTPSNELGSNCLPGSVKGKGDLCIPIDKKAFMKTIF